MVVLKRAVPVDQQVFLHSEAVCSPIASPGLAVGAAGRSGLSGVMGRVFFIAVQVRDLATFTTQRRELPGLLPHARRIDHKRVLQRDRRGRIRFYSYVCCMFSTYVLCSPLFLDLPPSC